MNLIGSLVDDPNMLMFTDESARDERTSARRYGWATWGQRCVCRKFFVRGCQFSIIPILTLDGIITYDIIEGPVTAARFLEFLREMVVSHIDWLQLCPHISLSLFTRYLSPMHIQVLGVFSYLTIAAYTMQKRYAS